ncbi:hypothetical protein JW766_02250 [Candidatus Dojkabacteria bacterium]|nr:hypothetical protein [Candidatus Dojkabacteria bacterium]
MAKIKGSIEKYAGIWHIYEMETWDEDYFNMEVQAYIEIKPNGSGDFQFGLVSGQIDGEVAKDGNTERFEFSWDGSDECDPASGSGWFKLKDDKHIEGKIKIHHGDSSTFLAKRPGN